MKKIVAVLALSAAGLGSSAVLAGAATAAPPSVGLRVGSDNPSGACVGVSVDLVGATVGTRTGGVYDPLLQLGDQPHNRCDI